MSLATKISCIEGADLVGQKATAHDDSAMKTTQSMDCGSGLVTAKFGVGDFASLRTIVGGLSIFPIQSPRPNQLQSSYCLH
jgi:hypothetical protein